MSADNNAKDNPKTQVKVVGADDPVNFTEQDSEALAQVS